MKNFESIKNKLLNEASYLEKDHSEYLKCHKELIMQLIDMGWSIKLGETCRNCSLIIKATNKKLDNIGIVFYMRDMKCNGDTKIYPLKRTKYDNYGISNEESCSSWSYDIDLKLFIYTEYVSESIFVNRLKTK